jgi:intracellular septation protein A
MTPAPSSPVPAPPFSTGRVTFAGLLLGFGPRFARDAAGPVLAFYVGWKLVGLAAGVAAASTVALLAFWWERRRGASGAMPAMGLGIAAIQALAGLASGSATVYFAPSVVANGLYGLVFVGSVAIGKPLAGVLARETFPFPPRVWGSTLFRQIFSRVSMAWGALLLVRAVIRLFALVAGGVDVFVLVSVLTGLPLTALLMSWSLWYPMRAFRRQPELWSPAESHGAG